MTVTEWNAINVTWMCIAAAAFVWGIVYAWLQERKFQKQTDKLQDELTALAELLSDVCEEKHPLENAYRTAGIDGPPTRRELDSRLRAVEDVRRKLPVAGEKGRQYCVDCKYSFMAANNKGMGCEVYPSKYGFAGCDKMNPKFDCDHFRKDPQRVT